MENEDLPIGLLMAFAEQLDRFEYFSKLDHEQQQQILNHAKTIQSKQEMHEYVNNLPGYK